MLWSMATAERANVPIPALIRAARGAYGHAVVRALARDGFEDLPRNGAFVLGGIANHGVAAGDLIRQLGVSKQAASQLVDALVVRGYVERAVDADDRRRITITVTERGRAAAASVRGAVLSVDAELEQELSPQGVQALRRGLEALTEIRQRMEQG
jgi:DNA-binding MarR family transcriptional regulator